MEKIPKSASKEKLVDILHKNQNVALLLGNGFNRHFYKSTSWTKLVTDLWNESHSNSTITEKEVNDHNLSLTETAEMSESPLEDIRQKVANTLSNNFTKNEGAAKFLKFLEARNIPILTTNYDNNIAQELLLSELFTIRKKEDIIPPRFQWGRYYAKETLCPKDILHKFAVWHIHGTIEEPASICFSLSDYIECIGESYRELEGICSYFYIGYQDSYFTKTDMS